MTKMDSIFFGDRTDDGKRDKMPGKPGVRSGPTWRRKRRSPVPWNGSVPSGHAMITNLLLCLPRTCDKSGGPMNGAEPIGELGRIGGLPRLKWPDARG